MTSIKPPLFEIIDEIPLEELGYEKGSKARVVINATREWEWEWSKIFDQRRKDDEAYTDFQMRKVEPQYPLAVMVIKGITIIPKGAKPLVYDPLDEAGLREIDNADPNIMELVLLERKERALARAVNTHLTFRGQRSNAAEARQKGKFEGSLGGDNPSKRDESGK